MQYQQPAQQQQQQRQQQQQQQQHKPSRSRPSGVVNVRVSLSDITKSVATKNVTGAAAAKQTSTASTAVECSVVKVKDSISAESRRVVDSLNDLKKKMFVMKAKAAKGEASQPHPHEKLAGPHAVTTASRQNCASSQQMQQRQRPRRAKSRSKSRSQTQRAANTLTTQPAERKKHVARPRRTTRQATKRTAPPSAVERRQHASNSVSQQAPRPTNPVAVQQRSAEEPPTITSSFTSGSSSRQLNPAPMPSTTPSPARLNKKGTKRNSDVHHTAIKLIDTPVVPQDNQPEFAARGQTLSAVPLVSPAPKYLPSTADESVAPGKHFTFDDIASRFQNSIAALRKPAPMENFSDIMSSAVGTGAPVSPSAFSPHCLTNQHEASLILPVTASQANSRSKSGEDQTSHAKFANSGDQIAQLQKKIDAAATSKQFLRAAMLHAQLQQLTAVPKSNGRMSRTPTQAAFHNHEEDGECDSSSMVHSTDELATPNLTLLGVQSPLFTPNVMATRGACTTQTAATECNNTILMASPAELPVGDASCVALQDEASHVQRRHVTFALPVDSSECGVECVDNHRPQKQLDAQSEGFSVQKFLSDNSLSFEDKIKTLSRRLRDFKQRHADQQRQQPQGGLFGYGPNANVMNQPIADEEERMRLAQQMVEDYLQGRIPPPPQFDAPNHV
eukprot:INCI16197.1.p1 GENE.INCI16197.1~~INCI16197.1.p1  ORF type:complete len:674 (+),score=128.68 INCI16197.1:144-2165(+)